MSKRRHMFVMTPESPRMGVPSCGARSKLTGTKVCKNCREINEHHLDEQNDRLHEVMAANALTQMLSVMKWVLSEPVANLTGEPMETLEKYLTQSPEWNKTEFHPDMANDCCGANDCCPSITDEMPDWAYPGWGTGDDALLAKTAEDLKVPVVDIGGGCFITIEMD